MKKAVLLMSMGGPGRAEDIKPFLFNLFKDKAILRYPCFVRYILAFIISTLRTPLARGNYAKIGGGSPLLKNTQAQAMALEDALNIDAGDVEYKCFVGMRYWHPFIGEAVKQIKKYGPHEIILLPLYPQFSTTTTVSALDAAQKYLEQEGIKANYKQIKSFQTNKGYSDALVDLIENKRKNIKGDIKPHLLFSAHGLPQTIVDAGDPYPSQCAETMQAVLQKLPFSNEATLCYQSKVGPQKWLEPSLKEALILAGKEKRPVIIVPISFVSEHIETLVELKMEYRSYAESLDIPQYEVVDTVGIHQLFISGLVQKLTKT